MQNGPDELLWLSVLYSMPMALIVFLAILALLPYLLTAERHTELRAYLGLRESGEEAELPDFRKPWLNNTGLVRQLDNKTDGILL